MSATREWIAANPGLAAPALGVLLGPPFIWLCLLAPWLPTVAAMVLLALAVTFSLLPRYYPDRRERNTLWNIFLLGLALRIVAAVILRELALAQGRPFLFNDAQWYWRTALKFAADWHAGNHVPVDIGTYETWNVSYIWYVGLLATFLGPYPEVIMTANILLSNLCVLLIHGLCRSAVGARTAATAAFLTAVFPTLLFWGPANLKESLLMVSAFAVIIAAVNLRSGFSISRLLFAVGALIIFFFSRRFVVYVLLATILLEYIVHMPRRPLKSLAALGVFILIIVKLAPVLGVPLTTAPQAIMLSVVEGIYEAGGASGALFGQGAGVSDGAITLQSLEQFSVTPRVFVRNTVQGSAHLLLTPLPWKLEDEVRWLIPGSALMYLLLPFMAVGFFAAVRKLWVGNLSIIVIYTVLMFLSVAIATLGSGERHRDALIPFFTVFAAMGLERAAAWKHLLAACFSLFALGLAAIAIGEAKGIIFVFKSVLPPAFVMFFIYWWLQRRLAARAAAARP